MERVPAGGKPAPELPRKVYALTPQRRALLHSEVSRLQLPALLSGAWRLQAARQQKNLVEMARREGAAVAIEQPSSRSILALSLAIPLISMP